MQSLNVEQAAQAVHGASDLKSLLAVFNQATNPANDEWVSQADQVEHGRVSYVVTVKGQEVKTAFKLVDASDLITSNSLDGKINAAYPQELQPRDRTRAASIMQITKLSKSLRPVQLADSGLSSHGAPIVGSDRVVESGNGRSMAIIKAYADGNADSYRKYLIDNAELYGLKRADVERMEQPVLVRVRLDDVDRLQFTKDSNISDLQAMSPVELARVDAENLDEKTMSLFSPSEGGDLLAASNLPFIQAFMQKLGSEQAAGYMTADGRPTKQVVDRIQGAIFAKAYQNEKLLKLSVEEPDPEIRNVLTALNAAAPDFIAMRYLSGEAHKQTASNVADGIEINSSLDNEALAALVDAATIVRTAKSTGQNIDEYLAQGALFGDTDPSAAALAKFIADNNRSAKRMGEAFRLLAGEINAELTHQGQAAGDMFGAPPLDLITVLARVSEQMQEQYGDKAGMTLGMFDSVLARQIAAAAMLVNIDPTPAQQIAGNYTKGHVDFHGLPLTYENPKGSVRRGVDASGKEWESKMMHHYGYIKRTEGADGDHVDFFLGDELDSDQVFIVNQIDQETGHFDEHKVMLGFSDRDSAHDAYLSNYETGWNAAESIHQLHMNDFKEWLDTGDTTGAYQPVVMLEATGFQMLRNLDFYKPKVKKARAIPDLLEWFDKSTGLKTDFEKDIDAIHDIVKGLSIATIDASVFFDDNLDKQINESLITASVKRVKDAKQMSATSRAALSAKVKDIIEKVKANPPMSRDAVYDGLNAWFKEYRSEGIFILKIANKLMGEVNREIASAKNADIIAGINPVKEIIADTLANSVVTPEAAQARAKNTPVKITSTRLAGTYSIPDVRDDLATLYQLSGGNVEEITLAYKKKRASANPYDLVLNVGNALTKETLWHEFGHFIEFHNKWVFEQATALLKRRYAGISDPRPIRKLADMCQSAGYGKNEVAINDGFFEPYVGRVYGTWPDVSWTEVVSMGMGCLSSDKGIAELAQKDPEHLALMLAIVKRLGKQGLSLEGQGK